MINLDTLTIDHALGEGGQGKVFLAFSRVGTRFAVKLIDVAPDLDLALFARRLASIARDSPSAPVLPVLGHCRVADAPPSLRRQLPKAPKGARLLVMHYVEGLALSELAAGAGLQAVEVAAALGAAAKKLSRLPEGTAHGDVRAPNLFVQPTGEVVVADPDLFREPAPEEDLRALGTLGRSLLSATGATAGSATGLPAQRLLQLLGELEADGKPPDLAETGRRFFEIAVALGAPADEPTAVLAKRVPVTALSAAAPSPTPPLDAPKRRAWWKPIALGVGAAMIGFCVFGIANVMHWHEKQPYETHATGSSTFRTPAPDNLYDTTGTVKYAEAVHELDMREHLQKGDGYVVFETGEEVPRLAILDLAGKVLWEKRYPPPATRYPLNVKPGTYTVELDRNLGDEGIQEDKEKVTVDVRHPFRMAATNTMMYAPVLGGVPRQEPWWYVFDRLGFI